MTAIAHSTYYMRVLLLLVLYPFLLHSFCNGQKIYQYTRPEIISDGWETTDLLSEGIDTTIIYGFFDQLLTEKHRLDGIVVVKEHALIQEEYFHGYTRDALHDLRSVTKSIISLLIGIAIEKGFIASVNDPVLKYIRPPRPLKNSDERKAQITIRHLLTMSSGLECNDWDRESRGQEDRVYRKRDWLQYTLDLPLSRDPGDSSLYCTMGTVLAAEAVSQASGLSIDKFANKYLFGPLGITNVAWGHTDKGKEVISSAMRLYMTPRDMAKIGQLVLNKGKWISEQIVSRAWVEESTSTQARLANMDYGYLWWKIPFRQPDGEIIGTVATGNGGQYIMLFPKADVVMVFTGGAYNSEEDKLPFAIVREVFLPALTGR